MIRRSLIVMMTCALFATGCDRGGGESGPHAGGTLRIPIEGAVQLDPALVNSRIDALVAGLLYTPLVTLPPGATELAPGVAGSWEVADDARSVTLTLDPEAVTGSGDPLTADDVIASLTRVATPAAVSPLSSLLAPVAGYAELQSGASATLSGLSSPDANTVAIALTPPIGDFVVNLAHPGLGIVPGGTPAPADAPVGSGAFRVAASGNDVVRLERAIDADPAPYVGVVEFIEHEKDPVEAVDAGRADLALVTEGDDADLPTTAGPYLAVGYYGLNTAAPVFSDARVREAAVLAINAQDVVTAAYGDDGVIAAGVLADGLLAQPVDACGNACSPAPKRARALLKQLATVPIVHIDFDDSPVQRRAAKAIVKQLHAVGFEAELRPHEADAYDDYLARGAAELFRFGWVADVASPRAFLSPAFATDAPENITGFADPAFTQALTTATGAAEPDGQRDAYSAAEESVLAAWVAKPLVSYRSVYVHRDAVRDLAVNVFGGIDGAGVWLDQ